MNFLNIFIYFIIPFSSGHVIHERIIYISNMVTNFNLNNETFNETLFSYPVTLNLIPVEKLSTLSSSFILSFLSSHRNDSSLITKFMLCLSVSKHPQQIFSEISKSNFDSNLLRLFVEYVMNRSEDLDWLIIELLSSGKASLMYTKPQFLIKFNAEEKRHFSFYLTEGMKLDTNNLVWNSLNSLSRRFLSHIVFEQNNPLLLNTLDSVTISKLILFLPQMDLNQIKHLKINFENNDTSVLDIDWNPVQARFLTDELIMKNETWLKILPWKFIVKLQPKHIHLLKSEVFERILYDFPSYESIDSLPTAMQIYEFLLAYSKSNNSKYDLLIDKEDLLTVGRLLYSQTPSYFQQLSLNNRSFDLRSLPKIDSIKLSTFQAYSILSRDIIKNHLKDLLPLRGFFNGVPASAFMTLDIHSVNRKFLNDVITYTPGKNVPRLMVILQILKTKYGPVKYIEKILENLGNELVSIISPIEIVANKEIMWERLRILYKFDELKLVNSRLLSLMLSKWLQEKNALLYEDIFNSSSVLNLAIIELDCKILSKIPVTDFIPIFSLYNERRKILNKEFPKDLQKCSQDLFLYFLQSKSALTGSSCTKNIISALELSDIKSVGGFILATLPVNIIFKSSQSIEIVREIGSLTLPELMEAASRQHLINITTHYLNNTMKENLIQLEHLLVLGNLTHFVADEYLGQINTTDFKFILQTELIDKRICGPAGIRNAWNRLLLLTYGPIETWKEDDILNMKDLLLSVPFFQMKKINLTVLLNIADLLKSNYVDNISWIPQKLPFYEVCLKFLREEEKRAYESSVSSLIIFYLMAVEKQLQTITKTDDILDSEFFSKLSKIKIISETRLLEQNNSSNINKGNHFNESGLDDSDFSFQISCSALKVLGLASFVALPSISIMENENEIFDCIELFGEMNLPAQMKQSIWSKISDKLTNPNLNYIAGKILSVLSSDDIDRFNFTIDSDWSLEMLYAITDNVDSNLHEKIIRKFFTDNPKFLRERLPIPVITSLGKLICELPFNTLQNILLKSNDLSDIWILFERFETCLNDCFEKLVNIFITMWGNPIYWKPHMYSLLGPVLTGLNETYLNEITQNIPLSAITCLTEDLIKNLNSSHFANMSFSSLLLLIDEKKSLLSEEQLRTIHTYVHLSVDENMFAPDDPLCTDQIGKRAEFNLPHFFYYLTAFLFILIIIPILCALIIKLIEIFHEHDENS